MSPSTFGLRFGRFGWLALLLASTGLVARPATGQAIAAGTRTLSFDVFAGVSELKLDTGTAYNKISPGFAAGVDVTRRFSRFDLSIEPRFGRTVAKANDDTQTYILGDIVLSKQYRHFHVFGLGGIGYGKINYGQGADLDNSIVYTVGPGLQYDLPFNLAVKADWQYQSWSVGTETKGFNPNGFTISGVYRLHFRR